MPPFNLMLIYSVSNPTLTFATPIFLIPLYRERQQVTPQLRLKWKCVRSPQMFFFPLAIINSSLRLSFRLHCRQRPPESFNKRPQPQHCLPRNPLQTFQKTVQPEPLLLPTRGTQCTAVPMTIALEIASIHVRI